MHEGRGASGALALPGWCMRRVTTAGLQLGIAILLTGGLGACGGGSDAPPLGASPYPAGAEREAAALVESEMSAANLPGVVLGVWTPGAAPLIIVRGQADLATGRPRTVDDPFRVASITKSFTSTAILTLVDAGKLKTGDLLSNWYADFPNADRITIDDLLRMRSGIADAADHVFVEGEYYQNPLTTLSAEQMIARSAARASEFEAPNTAVRYTNTNFVLLERIVEKVSGQDFASYLAEHVYAPLGLKHTVYPKGPEFDSPLHGYSFEAASGLLVDRTLLNPTPAGGAGALISTLDDLRVYARALCRGDLLKSETQRQRLLTDQIADEPAFIRYGEGLTRIGRFCGHNGTIFGFSSEMFYLPERDAVIVINVNRLDADDVSRSSTLFFKLTKLLFPDLTDW